MFAAVGPDDTQKDAESLAAKVLKVKIWPDEAGGTVCFNPKSCSGGLVFTDQKALTSDLNTVEEKRSRYTRRSPMRYANQSTPNTSRKE